MQVSQYYNTHADGVQISRDQGSRFAKLEAGDFNPLHDADAKRFVVPGDLLFSLLLTEFGGAEKMDFSFSGMVNEEMTIFLAKQGDQLTVSAGEKVMTSATIAGAPIDDTSFITQLVGAYVSFSGQTYPHILVPVMRDAGVMINPARPMVMYQSMSIELDQAKQGEISLRPSEHQFDVNGKRGDMYLNFDILCDGDVIGRGSKHMLLSGLREYNEAAMTKLTEEYDSSKAKFTV